MVIPEGARLLPGTIWFKVVEYIPRRTVCHRYPYMRYVLELPDDADREAVFGDTLPQEIRDMCPVEGCMLSASMIAFIMTQRYAYYLPQKRIKVMLRDMGAHIPRTTPNRFFMDGAQTLLTMLGDAFRAEIRRGGYFMVDETLQTVGVDSEELGRRYMNRYLWEFYNLEKGLVENMAWFTPAPHPDERYYFFGYGGAARLAEELDVPLLAQIPLVADICEKADTGHPISTELTGDESSHNPEALAFADLAERTVKGCDRRNRDLPLTQAVQTH